MGCATGMPRIGETSSMALFWSVIAFVLYLYLLLIIARIVVEIARQFAKSWRPVGVTGVGLPVIRTVVAPGRRPRCRARAGLHEHGSPGETAAADHSAPPHRWGKP